MAYTVKQLSKLSGVSIRTLHWYDQTGLLKPAYHGANGYRYYEEEQLLPLRQILFFRELGFPLKEIQRILAGSHFDRLEALHKRREVLKENLVKTKQLIKMVDRALSFLKEGQGLDESEFYKSLSSAKEEPMDDIFVKKYEIIAEALAKKNKLRVSTWGKSKWRTIKEEGEILNKALAEAIDEGVPPESEVVQKLLEQHSEWIQHFYMPLPEMYEELSQLYKEHPNFRRYLEGFHPKLADYFADALRIFASAQRCS